MQSNTITGQIVDEIESILELNNTLTQLQDSATNAAAQLRTSNRTFYGHLAELYLWWRKAETVNGYLSEQYAKTNRRYKAKVKHGINFAPLFWLIWGVDNDLNDDKVNRWSRVLNRLHEVYEAEKQYHTESIAKLQNFIEQNGGVDGLISYGSGVEDNIDDDEADLMDNETVSPRDLDDWMAQLYEKAKNFYRTTASLNPVNLNTTIPVSNDGLGLVLVRKVGNQYHFIGDSTENSLMQPVTIDTYLRDYTVLPPSVRCLFEIISTQCLPQRLQAFYKSLVDSAAKGTGNKNAKSIRRLMYRHDRNELILSPIRADSGVVTVAKTKQVILANATADIFMSTRSRRLIERRLISGREFNLYTANNINTVPQYKYPGLASHAVRLHDIFDGNDVVHVDFWPFYSDAKTTHAQLTVVELDKGFGTWRAELTTAWIKQFAIDFTSKWLGSHGNHIKREHQQVFQLAFDSTALTVHYVYRDGQFENHQVVDFDRDSVNGKPINVHVMTKDFAVVMQAIADLNVDGLIDMEVDEQVLVLRFVTTAADYCIYIPTCSIAGQRQSTYFQSYSAIQTQVDPVEDYCDPTDESWQEVN